MLIKVKAARVNAGLTTKEVAEKLSISHSCYVKKEAGKTRFYCDEIGVLSEMLNVDYSNFFEVKCRNKTQIPV
jgi:hypothetical protein